MGRPRSQIQASRRLRGERRATAASATAGTARRSGQALGGGAPPPRPCGGRGGGGPALPPKPPGGRDLGAGAPQPSPSPGRVGERGRTGCP
ncbi:hypothetical protein KBY76_07795, partial [Synechococcus sp. GreenBA-s]|nr:hypothetical protein [Synechococcus sp. GreenBA-s]